jgi:hypothetical protein
VSILFLSLVVVPVLVAPILMVWALVDLLQRPAVQWEAAGEARLVWALVIVLVALVGPLLYLLIGRKSLENAGQIPPPPAGFAL